MLAGCPYSENLSEDYVENLLEALLHPCVILTGVGYPEDETVAAVYNGVRLEYYHHPKKEKNFSGTGDMFAACFTGSWLQGKSMEEAVKIAGEFTRRSIEETFHNPAHWYGVKFETQLPWLTNMLFE